MPLIPTNQLSNLHQQQQQQEQIPTNYSVRVDHVGNPTRVDTLEMYFKVTDPDTGKDQLIKCEGINPQQLFEMTTEGQAWLSEHSQRRGAQSINRRSA